MNLSTKEIGQPEQQNNNESTVENQQVSPSIANAHVSGSCGQNMNESKQIVIECSCGTHLLKVQSEVEYFDDTINKMTRFNQEYYLAMFSYGSKSDKDNFWRRIKIGFKYLKTGKMFSDQLVLSQDEAKKLSTFITETMIEGKM